MAKVTALCEIIRPDGVIKPNQKFESTGEELDSLLKMRAVKKGWGDTEGEVTTSEAKNDSGNDTGDGGKPADDDAQAVTAAKPAAKTQAKQPAAGKKAKSDEGLV